MEFNFQNNQIDIVEIPSIGDLHYTGVERNYLKVRIINSLILGLVFSIILGSLFFTDLRESADGRWVYLGLVVLFILLFVLSLLSSVKGFQYMSYALRERDIVFKKGWIWKSQTMIPFKRVQHCEVNQSPVERFFELAKLKVYTAGGSASDLSISGLNPQVAERLKHFITTQNGNDEEE